MELTSSAKSWFRETKGGEKNDQTASFKASDKLFLLAAQRLNKMDILGKSFIMFSMSLLTYYVLLLTYY